MARKTQSLGFVALIGLFVFFPSSAQAAEEGGGGSSCSATGIFSSCSVTCKDGETPVCTVGFFGTPVSCTCSGGAVSGSTSTTLLVNRAQEIAFNGYVQLVSTLPSPESQDVLNAAVQMTNAARANNVPAYFAAAAWHEEALGNLPPDELAQLSNYLVGPQGPQP